MVAHLLRSRDRGEHRAKPETVLREFNYLDAIQKTASEGRPLHSPQYDVYNAVHQTYLPKLQAFDIVDYDRERKIIRRQPGIRSLSQYIVTTL